jgi:hypothetical protein
MPSYDPNGNEVGGINAEVTNSPPGPNYSLISTSSTTASWQLSSGSKPTTTRLNTGTGFYVAPIGCKYILVEMTGGGGGGSGSNGAGNIGGGGGAGAYIKKYYTNSGTFNYVVGGGGAGGSNSIPGSNGSQTFLTHTGELTDIALGGFGAPSANGGDGGTFTAAGHVLALVGGGGTAGAPTSGVYNGGGGSNPLCGSGGTKVPGQYPSVPQSYGGGGHGSQFNDFAGDGAPGTIIIVEFY